MLSNVNQEILPGAANRSGRFGNSRRWLWKSGTMTAKSQIEKFC